MEMKKKDKKYKKKKTDSHRKQPLAIQIQPGMSIVLNGRKCEECRYNLANVKKEALELSKNEKIFSALIQKYADSPTRLRF